MVLGIVLAILAAGLGATAVLYQQAESDAEQAESDLVVRASRVLQASSVALAAALAGASAIVGPSGTVDRLTFETFAKGAVGTTRVSVLAFVPLIVAERRAEFETAAGRSITEPGANGFISADSRPEYLPVQYVYPATDTSRSVIGFDTASDPIRLATSNAARDAGKLVFSAPVPSQPSGQTSVFFAEPLFEPGARLDTLAQRRAAIIGFASGLTPSRSLLDSIMQQLPEGARLRITDGEELLAVTPAGPAGGHSTQIEQAGRTWTITVEYDSADFDTTWLMFFATLVLAGAVWFFLLRNLRQTNELRVAAMNVRQLGRLSERLAVADDREQMIRTILEQTTSMVGAVSARVAMQLGDDSFQATSAVRRGDETTIGEAADIPIDKSTPTGAAWLTGTPVYVVDSAALRAGYRAAAGRWTSNGLEAGAALPIRRPNGELMGVIELAWSRPRRFRGALRSTLLTTAEVCQQSLYRAEVQTARWESAAALSELSQRLSVSRTLDQIAEVVIGLGAFASGADHVAVGFLNEASTAMQFFHSGVGDADRGEDPASFEIAVESGPIVELLKRGQPLRFDGAASLDRFPVVQQLVGDQFRRLVCMPLIDADTQLRGVIAFVYLEDSTLQLQPDAGRLDTIADLTAQTVERSLLYRHEHALVLDLQRQTLADLPDIDGLQLAARYLPASSLLGLGGDWYDVSVLDDGRVGIVVGDVAGHGIDAIADMAEFRTTISTLLRTNSDLGQLPARSTALLNGSGPSQLRFATAGLMIVDVAEQMLSYVRAGHPPSMVRTLDGEIHVLEAGGGAPIGIESAEVCEHGFGLSSGSVLVAYTDGLIERRDESIDVGLVRLADALRECESSDADVIVDTLIARCLGGRQTDDDTAVLVVVVE